MHNVANCYRAVRANRFDNVAQIPVRWKTQIKYALSGDLKIVQSLLTVGAALLLLSLLD